MGSMGLAGALKPKVVRALPTRLPRGHGGRAPWLHTGAASLRQSQRCLLVTQSKPVTPTRKRKRFIGTNRGDALVGVPALGVDSMWSLPLGKKRELLDKLRVGMGGPTGSGGEDDDDEELAAKAP